ncbi:nucleotidyltransferase family protein [Candidatus Woesearchaeota archaeon]|nr:nucleotidyltransferase family protein [Candidatus Woesearchaeota archaeon]
MKKEKIAISLDRNILELLDSKVDGSVIRSRSQAVEFYLKKGLKEESIDTAVILLKGEHQSIAMRKFKGTTLISSQIDFLAANGITHVYILTQHTKIINNLLEEISKSRIKAEIIEKDSKGNASALVAAKGRIANDFIAMSGDVYNHFNLRSMIEKHKNNNKMATMGLMSREKASEYGNVILDGDIIIDFTEKPKKAESNIVNAGIYIFRPEIFNLLSPSTISLESDLFPVLARQRQLLGFFTHGEYGHVI